MKALVIGVGALAVVGGGAYAQYSMNQVIESELVKMTDAELISRQAGMPVTVTHSDQKSGLFSSSGSVVYSSEIPEHDGSMEILIDYKLDHSVLSGVQYETTFKDIRVLGEMAFSATDDLFNGKQIRVVGEMEGKGATGQAMIPAMHIEEDGATILSAPAFPMDFSVQGFDVDPLIGSYTASFVLPTMDIHSPEGTVSLEGLNWSQGYEGDDKGLMGDFAMSIAKIANQSANPMMGFELNNLSLGMDTRIGADVLGTLELKLASVTSAMGAVSDLSLKTRTGGVDGGILKDFLMKANQLQMAGPSEAGTKELEQFLTDNLDPLLAPSPYFEIEQLQFDMNGQRFVEASGKVALQSDKLPTDYFSSLFQQKMAPDETLMMSAMSANLNSSFGPQAAMMIGPLHPMLMAVLQSGEPISFQLENGQMMLNGQPL